MTYRLYNTLLMALLILTLSACSKDGDTITPVSFPTAQTATGEAGQSLSLTFEMPQGNWELKSGNPVWCRLSYGEQHDMASVVGNGGTATIVVLISDDAADFTQSCKTELTLSVGSQQQVIATITRGDIKPTATLRQNGQTIADGDKIVIGGEGSTEISIQSNYGLPCIRHSEWFDVTLQDGIYTLKLAEGVDKKYSQPNGSFTLAMDDEFTAGVQTYGVSFCGMNPTEMSVTLFQYKPEGSEIWYTISAYNWEVSADGKTISNVRPNGDTVESLDYLPITIDALDDDIVFAYLDGDRLTEIGDGQFFQITQDKSDVRISVDGLPEDVASRSATLFAFPRASWNMIKDLQSDEWTETYNRHVIFSFTQKQPAVSFEVEYCDWWGTWEMLTVPVKEVKDAGLLTAVKTYVPSLSDISEIDATVITVNTYAQNKAYSIYTLMGEDEWQASNGYDLLDMTTGESVKERTGFKIEPGLDERNRAMFSVSQPDDCSISLLLVIYKEDGTGFKGLVIKN